VADRLEGDRATSPRKRPGITGVLGFVARASGLDIDARADHPFAAYEEFGVRRSRASSPAMSRPAPFVAGSEEAHEFRFGLNSPGARSAMGGGSSRRAPRTAPCVRAGVHAGRGLARGPFIHWVHGGRGGTGSSESRCSTRSFLNWRALSYALLKKHRPDFPLHATSRSISFSYSGNDLLRRLSASTISFRRPRLEGRFDTMVRGGLRRNPWPSVLRSYLRPEGRPTAR